MATVITPDGTKAQAKVLLDAINNLFTDNQTTRDLIITENKKTDIKLEELRKQLQISNRHNEIMTGDIIQEDEF